MILYFSGPTYQHVILEVIEKTNQMAFPTETSNEIDLLKTVRQNITKYDGIDILIVDESVCVQNTEEELLAALEMLRSMYDQMRIIILAPYRQEGDDFLTKCLQMGIVNIINTDDFLEIRQQMEHCMVEGMTYREAVRFKESKRDKVIVRHEIKRTVNKRMIGIAGSERHIGVTHHTVVLANFFRKQGFMVALAEMNPSGAFDRICDDYEEKKFRDGYFTLNGIDFYANFDTDMLPGILEHSYNIVILDMGVYESCDRTLFERCEDRIVIAGAKPWELPAMDKVFGMASRDALMKYIFCFNFVQPYDFESIREGMGEIENVHFLDYTADPFSSSEFADAEDIFSDCLPEKEEKVKKGLLVQLKAKKRKGAKNERQKG